MTVYNMMKRYDFVHTKIKGQHVVLLESKESIHVMCMGVLAFL